MNKNTKKLVRKFARRMDRYVGMEMTHCGHEGPMVEAMHARDHLLDWLGEEIEATNRLAVAESNNLNRGPG